MVAGAAEWSVLLSAAARDEDTHHVKVVCLSLNPSGSDVVKLMCFSPTGHPLAIGKFLCQEGFQHLFTGFSPVATMHPVFEIVFEEGTDDDDDLEGVIVGFKDDAEGISAAHVHQLRATMDE